jgi:hypothetical protein
MRVRERVVQSCPLFGCTNIISHKLGVGWVAQLTELRVKEFEVQRFKP